MRKGIIGFCLLFCCLAFATQLKLSFKTQSKGVQISSIEFVPSKVIERLVSLKSAHGKVITRKIPVPLKKFSKDERKLIKDYIVSVKSKLDKFYAHKFKKLKGHGELRLQIRSKGQFDVLFASSSHPKIQQKLEEHLYHLSKLPVIPVELNLEEIQLKIRLLINVKS